MKCKKCEEGNIIEEVIQQQPQANWYQRLQEPTLRTIPDGLFEASHKLSYSQYDDKDVIYPLVQEYNGKLVDLSFNPKLAERLAIQNNNTVSVPEGQGEYFTTNYKNYLDLIRNSKNKISSGFKDFIQRYEKFEPKTYLDSKGIPTIGYGTTHIKGKPVKMGQQITEQEASKLLDNYLVDNESTYSKYFPEWKRFPDQFKYGIMDIAYNGGPDNFLKKSPKFTKAINDAFQDGVMDFNEYQNIIKELEVDNTSGNHKDRKERRAALLGNLYDFNDNSYINYSTTSESPYKDYHKKIFYSPMNLFKPVKLKTLK